LNLTTENAEYLAKYTKSLFGAALIITTIIIIIKPNQHRSDKQNTYYTKSVQQTE